MRLISQDGVKGVFDFPYEKCIVYIYNDMKTIKIQPVGEENSQFIVASYSNTDKALKAMEMLREQYFDNKHEETYRDGACNYAPNFKFPADEEVEV